MTLEYTLDRKDYLNLHMAQVKNRKAIHLIAVAMGVLSLFVGGLGAQRANDLSQLFPLVPAGIFLLTYAFFIKTWLLKRHYGKYIDENLKRSFNKKTSIAIGEGDYIKSFSALGEGKFKIEVLKDITEYANYIFIKLENGAFFILPKEKINDFELNAFIDKIKSKVDIPHNIDLKKTLSYE